MSDHLGRQALLEATLKHVPFDGWSDATLALGSQDLGDESLGWRLFPGGPREMIELWSQTLDRTMLDNLKDQDIPRIRDKITAAVKARISLLAPHKQATIKTMTFFAYPQNAPLAARLMCNTVDEIWYFAGDTSTDYNYYTKRTLLSGVYASTLLYWLKDNSEDSIKTWAFLENRIENVMQIPKAPKLLKEKAQDLRWRLKEIISALRP